MGEVVIEENRIQTTKSDQENHGRGMLLEKEDCYTFMRKRDGNDMYAFAREMAEYLVKNKIIDKEQTEEYAYEEEG